MEKPQPNPDFSGNGEPPKKTAVGLSGDSEKSARVLEIVSQMKMSDLIELNLRLRALISEKKES